METIETEQFMDLQVLYFYFLQCALQIQVLVDDRKEGGGVVNRIIIINPIER